MSKSFARKHAPIVVNLDINLRESIFSSISIVSGKIEVMKLLLSFDLGSKSSILVSTDIDADNKLSKRTIFDAKQTRNFVGIHQQKSSFEDHTANRYQAKSYIENKSGQYSSVTLMKIF